MSALEGVIGLVFVIELGMLSFINGEAFEDGAVLRQLDSGYGCYHSLPERYYESCVRHCTEYDCTATTQEQCREQHADLSRWAWVKSNAECREVVGSEWHCNSSLPGWNQPQVGDKSAKTESCVGDNVGGRMCPLYERYNTSVKKVRRVVDGFADTCYENLNKDKYYFDPFYADYVPTFWKKIECNEC